MNSQHFYQLSFQPVNQPFNHFQPPNVATKADGVEGDIGRAFQWLRKRGIAKATSMADRSANEGE